jgi:hypothetical protein
MKPKENISRTHLSIVKINKSPRETCGIITGFNFSADTQKASTHEF